MNETPCTYEGITNSGSEWQFAVSHVPDLRTGRPLVTVMFRLFPNDTTVSIDGIDRPGVWAWVTGLFKRFGLRYLAYVADRGRHGTGSRCEFPSTPEIWQGLRQMRDHILRHPEELQPQSPVPFDRVLSLCLTIQHDEAGVLLPVAKYLAKINVNIRCIRAEREDESDDLGLPEVKVSAILEVPRIDCDELKKQIKLECPESELTVETIWEQPSLPCKPNHVIDKSDSDCPHPSECPMSEVGVQSQWSSSLHPSPVEIWTAG